MSRAEALASLPFANGRRAAPISVGVLLGELSATFVDAAISAPRDEARDIIAAVLGTARFWPLVEADTPIDDETATRVRAAARRRLAGAPFAYATGVAAFRHLNLHVDDRVLIPRQETEVLVGLVLEAVQKGTSTSVAADIGTGSGAIAVALATEGRFERIIATDVSLGALDVARRNAIDADVTATIDFRHGSALAPLRGEMVDVLVANPPYVSFEEVAELPRSVRDWEPITALISGDGGLAVTREIVAGASAVLRAGGLIALECDSRRAGVVAGLLADTGAFRDVCVHRDLTGRDRFVLARRA